MSSTTKINPYSLSDLKATTDDALPNYLNSLSFTQSHRAADTRLLLGYGAVLIAGALFYFDYRHGWAASRPYTLPAVLAYFALNAAFTYRLWFVERGLVYEGSSSAGLRLRVRSSAEKHAPVYRLAVSVRRRGAGGEQKEEELRNISAPFTRWFTQDGRFVARPFQQWLASEIDAVGQADPANVVEEIGRGNQSAEKQPQTMNVDLSNLDAVLAGLKKKGQAPGGKARRRA